MYESIIKPLEYVASSLAEGVSGLFGTAAVPLSHGRREVSLPEDLFAHADVQTEWWYYTGHCKRASGGEFGFELVFFKRRTDLDMLGNFPVRALANPMYFAHFAITDLKRGKFDYRHVRSFGMPFELPVAMSQRSYELRIGDWSVREVAGHHILHATLDNGIEFDAILESTKPVVLNGDDGSGVSKKSAGTSNHFSFTRMNVQGRISEDNGSETFDGTAWMDREFGSWEQKHWDWFSVQFDDDTELMVYRYRDDNGDTTADSVGTFVDSDGNAVSIAFDLFALGTSRWWTSPETGTRYPSEWRIEVPSLEIDIEIRPKLSDQELNTKGTTMIVYWEGSCHASGTKGGEPVRGNAYVELVGYDRSHEDAALGEFLFGEPIRRIRRAFSKAAFSTE